MIFAFLFIVGAIGIFTMTLLGMIGSGGGHGGHSTHAVHQGHAHAFQHSPNTHALPHGAGGHGAAHGHAGHAVGSHQLQSLKGGSKPVSTGQPSRLLSFIPSPLDLFSMSMGAGLVGIVTRHLLSDPARALAAIAGALVMNFLIVRPMFAFGLKFASKPSEGLEGTVANVAHAITRFDEKGKGLVRLTLDGQVVQLLANLEPTELDRGVKVEKGDEVIVTQVDSVRNTCCVTREFSL